MNDEFTDSGHGCGVRYISARRRSFRGPSRIWFYAIDRTRRLGDPQDPDEAVRVLRRAVELGVTFIDTADSYGPFTAELVIATKAGLARFGPDRWQPLARPEYLRQQVELSLRHLGLDRIDLFQLHRIDQKVSLEDQIGELKSLQDEGKIRYIGLSEVTVDDVKAVTKIASIVSVQNLYNMTNRSAKPLVDYATEQGIGFIPWYPLAAGDLARQDGALQRIANKHDATPAQLMLAWLLKRSPMMLPIPGTSSVAHLEENISAAGISLTDEEFAELNSVGL